MKNSTCNCNCRLQQGQHLIEEGVSKIISGLNVAYGLDVNDVNLIDTPARVGRAYLEMCQGIDPNKSVEILKQNFPSNYTGMVVLTKIPVFSLCPHHFLPVKYESNFGYIPKQRVLGLSKIPRYIKMLAQSPILQEDLAEKIVQLFFDEVAPYGCIITLKGYHMCMGCRGVEMPCVATTTTAFRGTFQKQDVREEFFTTIHMKD